LPPEVSEETAEAARSTLGGAWAVAQHLPEHTAAALLDGARHAFAQAFEITAVICAVAALAAAGLAAVLLRSVGGAEHSQQSDSQSHGTGANKSER